MPKIPVGQLIRLLSSAATYLESQNGDQNLIDELDGVAGVGRAIVGGTATNMTTEEWSAIAIDVLARAAVEDDRLAETSGSTSLSVIPRNLNLAISA
jgi:hypothetical protein